jgi:hypothetical protein
MTMTDTQAAPVNACDMIAIAPDELEGSIALAKHLLFKEAQRFLPITSRFRS